MKPHVLSLACLFAFAAPAYAQSPPPQNMPGGPPGMRDRGPGGGDMQAMHDAMTRARVVALAALSPAHRAAVARIVGELAVSSSPDPKSAASQIDALLSSPEKLAILAAAQSMHDGMHRPGYNPGGPMIPAGASPAPLPSRPPMPAPDAGRVLLGLAMMGMMPHEMMMHHEMMHRDGMHGMPPGGPGGMPPGPPPSPAHT